MNLTRWIDLTLLRLACKAVSFAQDRWGLDNWGVSQHLLRSMTIFSVIGNVLCAVYYWRIQIIIAALWVPIYIGHSRHLERMAAIPQGSAICYFTQEKMRIVTVFVAILIPALWVVTGVRIPGIVILIGYHLLIAVSYFNACGTPPARPKERKETATSARTVPGTAR